MLRLELEVGDGRETIGLRSGTVLAAGSGGVRRVATAAPRSRRQVSACAAALGLGVDDSGNEAPGQADGGSASAPTCHTAVEGEECYSLVLWAMKTGIRESPELLPSCSEASSFETSAGQNGVVQGSSLSLEFDGSTSGSVQDTLGRFEECSRRFWVL